MSEDEKFARMVVALETIAGCMNMCYGQTVSEERYKKERRPDPGFELEYRVCPSCAQVVVHEVTKAYRHCTMCGKLSAVD